MRALLIIAVALWGGGAFAELPGDSATGWHSWRIDNNVETFVYVRLEDGVPTQIRTHTGDCMRPPKSKIEDHGAVTANENFLWFKHFVEMADLSNNMRDAALFGVAQSDSDQAYDYLERLITGIKPKT